MIQNIESKEEKKQKNKHQCNLSFLFEHFADFLTQE